MAATILEGSAFNSWTHTFSLWCLNPAVIFREIADCSLSVILTSSYEQCEMQVHLEDNAKRCFIQHDKVFACCCTWRIMLRNPFLLGSTPVLGRGQGKKSEKNLSGSSEDNKKGAAFLAVCRGKVSEGIDFSDEMARVVIVVGIPFPNINDIQVSLKKKFNDTYKLSKSLLSGSEWYCQQAFRAVNQATGRCIRHKFDYGAIIFLDERFCQVRNRAYISKWLRNSIKQYDCFDDSLDGLKSFFRDIKDRIGKPDDASQNSVINLDDMPSANKSRISRKTNQKVNNSTLPGEKAEANDANRIQKSAGLFKFSKMFTRCDLPNNQVSADIQGFISPNEKNSKDSRSYIDLECESPSGSRCSGEACTGDPQSTFVMETPGVSGTIHSTSPESFSKEYSNSTIIQESVQDLNNLTCDNMSISDVKQDPESKCLEVTPERKFCAVGNGIIPDVESSVNFSVNSRAEKRRKHLDVSLVSHLQGEKLDSAVASTPIDDCSPPSIECDSMFSLSDENGPKSPRSQTLNHCDKSYSKSSLAMDKRLQIFCSSCSSALGIPENNLIVKCSMTSSTKVHLKSLWKRKSDPDMRTSSIPILVSDMESINRRIYNITRETIPAQGIWCKDDGCVFKTVFCPFCANPNNCLGLQVMAADASNVQFLNKILFYSDSLLIKAAETSTMDLSPCLGSTTCGKAGPSSIENFSYTPYQSPTYVKADPSTIENFSYTPDKNSTGWRSTKSKMRLPKRGHL